MRSAWICVTIATVCGAVTTAAARQIPANDSARAETVTKLFTVTRMQEFHAQLLNDMVARYAQQPSFAPMVDVLRAFLAKHATFASFESELVAVHRQYYSETTLQELIRFYESPLGQQVLTASPAINARTSQIVSERMTALIPELTRELSRGKPN